MLRNTGYLAGVSVVAALVAGGALASGPKVSTAGQLHIQVTYLPSGVAGRVTIRGPGGYVRRVGRTTTLRRLHPGLYRISALPVRHGRLTYYATQGRILVRVSTTKARSSVSYYDTIPATTKVLAPPSVRSVYGPADAQQTVRIAPAPLPEGKAPAVGDIIAAGRGTNTPLGLLARVESVSSSRGGYVVKTRPVTLEQALRRGAFTVQQTVPVETSGRNFAEGLCRTSPDLKLSGSLSPRIHFNFRASWSLLHGIRSADFEVTVSDRAQLDADVAASALVSCETKPRRVLGPFLLPVWEFDVGPIPVVVSPRLSITIEGKVADAGDLTTSVSDVASATVGGKYRNGHFSPVAYGTNNFNAPNPPALYSSLSLSAYAGPLINVELDGLPGPEFNVDLGSELNADTSKNPWWTLDGCLKGGASLRIPILNLKWGGSDNLLHVCKQIAQGGPFVGTS